MIGITIYTFIYYVSMPVDLQIKPLSFYLSNTIENITITKNVNIGSKPDLLTIIPIGNSKSGIFNIHNSEVDIFMEDEFYNIDVEFTI